MAYSHYCIKLDRGREAQCQLKKRPVLQQSGNAGEKTRKEGWIDWKAEEKAKICADVSVSDLENIIAHRQQTFGHGFEILTPTRVQGL